MAEKNFNRKKKTSLTDPTIPPLGLTPPQARDFERAVLGAIMLEKDGYSIVSDLLKPQSFYEKAHEKIYMAIVDLASEMQPIDMLTVTEQLRRRGNLDEAGGPSYIAELTGNVGSAAHIEFHARIIAQKHLARELIYFSSNVQSRAFDEALDVDELMQEAEGSLFEISQRNVKKDVQQINPIIKESMDLIQKAAARDSGMSGLETGFKELDKLTSGWQNSDRSEERRVGKECRSRWSPYH